jgi:hypothetical protein
MPEGVVSASLYIYWVVSHCLPQADPKGANTADFFRVIYNNSGLWAVFA